MNRNRQLAVGGALIAVAAVLLLVFPETEFLIFEGEPLGVVLGIIGIIDVLDAARRSPNQGGDTT